MSPRIRIVCAGACAALAMLVTAAYASHIRKEADRVRAEALERYGGEVVSLVVCTDLLEVGDTISSSNVIEMEWLADLAPQDAVTSVDDVIGLQVTVPLAEGEPLTSLNFRDSTEMIEVPAGLVALTVPVTDKLGVPRDITVGATLVAYETADSGAQPIASQVKVLSTPSATGMGTSSTMTIAVAPDDVPRILGASASGSLRLVMPAPDVAGVPEDVPGEAPSSVPPAGEDQDEEDASDGSVGEDADASSATDEGEAGTSPIGEGDESDG